MKNQFKVDINSTKIIGLSIFIILIVGFSIFFFTIQYTSQLYTMKLSLLQESFFSQLDTKTDKIFIIGSSQVYAIDPILIQEQLSDLKYDFDVYNLSMGGATINTRSKIIDVVIDAKQKIILYGISGGDFAENIHKIDVKSKKLKNIFPDPQEIFNTFLMDPFLEKYDFLQRPKFFIGYFINDQLTRIFNTNPDVILLENAQTSKIPFLIFSEKNYVVMKNEDIRNEFDIKPNSINNLEENKILTIFKNMLEKFKENHIQVIIFTTPNNEVVLDTITDEQKKVFEKIVSNISDKYDLKVHMLTEKYSEMEIWTDFQHIALGPPSNIYTDDITKIIISEIEK
jgi:hypothetical protein